MGTQAQKKKLFNGMSARNAKLKLMEIWGKENPDVPFNKMAKQFNSTYNIGFLATAEMWHRLRSQNKSVELMIQAFAEAIARRNEKNNNLSATIHNQRLELAKRLKEIERLKIDLAFKQGYDSEPDHEQTERG